MFIRVPAVQSVFQLPQSFRIAHSIIGYIVLRHIYLLNNHKNLKSMKLSIKICLLFCFLQVVSLDSLSAQSTQSSPEFSFTLYAQDAIGNIDSVVIGYDYDEICGTLNSSFGEVAITTPFDSIFEMRLKGDIALSTMPYTKKTISCYEGDSISGGVAADVGVIIQVKYRHIRLSWNRNAFLGGRNPYCYQDPLLFDTSLFWFLPDWSVLNPIRMNDTNEVVMTFDTSQHTPNYFATQQVTIEGNRLDTAVVLYVHIRSFPRVSTQESEAAGGNNSLSLYPNPSSHTVSFRLADDSKMSVDSLVSPPPRHFPLPSCCRGLCDTPSTTASRQHQLIKESRNSIPFFPQRFLAKQFHANDNP